MIIRKKVIVKPPKPLSLNETSNPCTMYLCRTEDEVTFEAAMPAIRCKDYLQDLFFAEFTDKNMGMIYGFEWKKGQFNGGEISEEKYFYLYIEPHRYKEFPGIGMTHDVLENLAKGLGYKVPDVIHNNEGFIIVKFSNEYIQKPVVLSLIVELARCGGDFLCPSFKEGILGWSARRVLSFRSPGMSYLAGASQKVEDIMNGKIENYKDWSEYTSLGSIHNSSGFYTAQPTRAIKVDLKQVPNIILQTT